MFFFLQIQLYPIIFVLCQKFFFFVVEIKILLAYECKSNLTTLFLFFVLSLIIYKFIEKPLHDQNYCVLFLIHLPSNFFKYIF